MGVQEKIEELNNVFLCHKTLGFDKLSSRITTKFMFHSRKFRDFVLNTNKNDNHEIWGEEDNRVVG